MRIILRKVQPHQELRCDYCSGSGTLCDPSPHTHAYYVTGYGTFDLCDEHVDELRNA